MIVPRRKAHRAARRVAPQHRQIARSQEKVRLPILKFQPSLAAVVDLQKPRRARRHGDVDARVHVAVQQPDARKYRVLRDLHAAARCKICAPAAKMISSCAPRAMPTAPFLKN